MGSFSIDGQRLAYAEYGSGPKLTILLHGLLFNQRFHEALAHDLAERGHRLVALDLLGHGESDRPTDKWRYSMPSFGAQVEALLDELGEREAVILGTSLGANVALELAVRAPDRVRGMVVEMPVLDHALIGCALAFTPLMVALTAGEPAMRAVSRLTRLIPRRRLPWQADILLDWVRQDPAPSAAVFQGLFFDRIAPPRDERAAITAPTLVIGHQFDLVHPFSDAGMLADELPNARLLQAHSLVELRVSPLRLTNEIAGFLDECWRPRATKVRARAS
ncbi:alpha/beta hydrolase [Solirubrobacter phytolaccae]|uniref:Alpha/beta hydrolase n=1 Tax=Solirubrobacter phytolaccae TaxID=1404360 RepID=A0A9X3NEL0_9ACTN|nr:alpha/beta hydrolase [Solirubrobacter phytolaccae]MDA0183532.1 alpha/beta hydrolase [Solirubrobacter phytolaccae]